MKYNISKKHDESKKLKISKKNGNIYKLHSFPLAFQIWLYESIPALSESFCKLEDSGVPRMINWSTDFKALYRDLEREVLQSKEIEIRKVTPIDEEKKILNLSGFCYNSKDPVVRNLAKEDDDFEIPSPKFPLPTEPSISKLTKPSSSKLTKPCISKSSEPSTSRAKKASENALESSFLDLKNRMKLLSLELSQLSKNISLLQNYFSLRQDTIMRDMNKMKCDMDDRYVVIISMLSGIQEKLGCGAHPIHSFLIPHDDDDQVADNWAKTVVVEDTTAANDSVKDTKSAINEKRAEKIVERITVLLSLFLDCIGFYVSQSDVDLTSTYFLNKKAAKPLDISMIDDLPQQTHCDCGAFIIAYVKYFIHGAVDKLREFSVKKRQNKLCVELYAHACKKQMEDYESESEFLSWLKNKEGQDFNSESEEGRDLNIKKKKK
ncbi:Ulp1 protease family, C-terminal catalytic domain containing protein [Trema orientale]|uniref:Ulp1 protease family, C-terminal catalytic domain containing protein n=1 Tax=Trema orientale TaxID=63057 RepID=A0A2P5EF67_TREOI|nr:Ulp1 protease family, C-terminal catalytic domain containing protein [Trema orientale]